MTVRNRILLIGGAGFIGRHLAAALMRQGQSVRCFDRQVPDWSIGDMEYIQGDVNSDEELTKAIAGCGTIYHLASTTLPASSNADPLFDVSSNLLPGLRILQLAVEQGVGQLIFVSSGGTVYGRPASLPAQEQDLAQPMCSYGIVKLALEHYLALFNRLYGLSTCAVRLSNVYGEHQRLDRQQGVIPIFVDKALRGECIPIWGDGSVVRDFVYIQDVVDALCRVQQQARNTCEVLNIGAGEGTSLNQLLDRLEAILGRPVKREYCAARNFDVPTIYLDISRAKQQLGWMPQTDLDEGLRRVVDWLRHC